MAITFDYSVNLDAPPERVFGAMTSTDAMGQWMPGFVGIERITEGEFGLGTEFRETRKMFGMNSTEHFEVTAFDPPNQLAFRVDGTKGTSGKGVFLFSYRLEPRSDGTNLTMRGDIGGLSGGFMAFMCKLMMGSMKKACAKDMDALRAYLAASPPTATPPN